MWPAADRSGADAERLRGRSYDPHLNSASNPRTAMRLTRIKAKNLREGDKVVVTVARVMGVRGRKPSSGAPLMQLEYEDGTTETIREDQAVEVLR